MDEQIKKLWHIYSIEYYSTINKNEILPFAKTWMDFEGIILSKISQTEREIPYNFTSMWNIKETTTKQKNLSL